MNDEDAYNGNGTGSDMYINKSTTIDGFVHELGHQSNADKGTMDINSVRLNRAGFEGDWTRINDEKSADNFAATVIGQMAGNTPSVPADHQYSGYDFTSEDQSRYDEAVKSIQP